MRSTGLVMQGSLPTIMGHYHARARKKLNCGGAVNAYRRFTAAIARSYTASTFAAAPSQVMPRTSK